MPKLRHQILVELFRDHPRLSFQLIRQLGYPIPKGVRPRLVDSDLSTSSIVERRADLVTLGLKNERAQLAVFTEVQLRADPRKIPNWPLYVFLAQAALGCPAVVLVVAPRRHVAVWARREREVAPGIRYAPWVLGPDEVPVVSSFREARDNIELAVLAALAHADDPKEVAVPIVSRALRACQRLPGKAAVVYSEVILEALGPMMQEALVPLVETYKFRSEFAKKHQALGEARGERRGRLEGERRGRLEGERRVKLEFARQTIREALKARKLPLTAVAERRIAQETNQRTLHRWFVRAVTVQKTSQIFED